jgi:predicted DNA-binding protein (UPF0251 family)
MADTTIDYVAVLADMEAKRASLDGAIAGIRQWLSLGGAEEGVPNPQSPRPTTGNRTGDPVAINFDTFFGMSIPDAIRKCLGMMKQPRSVSEITNNLKHGGLPTTAKNLINSVGSTLSRMKSEGDVVQVHGKWGLKEWYPGWKEATTKSSKGRKRGRSTASKPKKTKAEPNLEAVKPEPAKPASSKFTSEQIERMRAMRADGKKDGEIGKEFGIPHLAVWRALKSKNDKQASA